MSSEQRSRVRNGRGSRGHVVRRTALRAHTGHSFTNRSIKHRGVTTLSGLHFLASVRIHWSVLGSVWSRRVPPQGRATQYLSTFIGPKRGSELARTRLLARLCRLEAAPAHAPPQADHGLRGVQRVQGAWHGPGHRAGLDAAGAPRGVSRWRSMDQSIAVPRGDWCHAEIPARRRSELTRSFLRQSAATEEWPVH